MSREGERELRKLGSILVELGNAPDTATGLTRYIFSLTTLGHELFDGLAEESEEAGLRAMHLARLIALARSFEDQRAAHNGRAEWAEFLDYIRVLLAMRQGGSGDDLLATARDGVWVLTVHASKGLEFPVLCLSTEGCEFALSPFTSARIACHFFPVFVTSTEKVIRTSI